MCLPFLCRSAWHWIYQQTYSHCLHGIRSRLTIWQFHVFHFCNDSYFLVMYSLLLIVFAYKRGLSEINVEEMPRTYYAHIQQTTTKPYSQNLLCSYMEYKYVVLTKRFGIQNSRCPIKYILKIFLKLLFSNNSNSKVCRCVALNKRIGIHRFSCPVEYIFKIDLIVQNFFSDFFLPSVLFVWCYCPNYYLELCKILHANSY